MLFTFLSTYGQISLAYGTRSASEILDITNNNMLGTYFVDVDKMIEGERIEGQLESDDAVREYLLSLNISNITGHYEMEGSEDNLTLVYYDSKGNMKVLTIQDHYLGINTHQPYARHKNWYYIQDMNWDFLNSQFIQN